MRTTTILPFCIIAMLLLANSAYCQYQDAINADRPGITISAYTVGKKVLQMEHGVEFFDNFEDTANTNTYTTDHVIRYGLSKRFEVNMLFKYQHDLVRYDNKEFLKQNGISNLQFGFRVSLCDEKKWRPAIIFQQRLIMPRISSTYGNEHLGTESSVSTNYSLPKNMTLGTTWVLAWDGNTTAPLGQYAINFGFPITGQLNAFVENYGQLQSQVFETRIDAGLMYVIGNNLQLDLSGGYGRNAGINDYFVSAGVAWRVRFREKEEKM